EIFTLKNFLYLPSFHGWRTNETSETHEQIFESSSARTNKTHEQIFESSSARTNKSEYLVYTDACKIPATPIMPEYYINNWNWKEEPVPDCREDRHFIPFVLEDEIIELKFYDLDYCSMYEIKRDNDSDDYELINHGKILERHYNVSSMDMFMAECNNSYNFEANIRTDKDSVQEKLNHWKNIQDKPISVLMIGVDTSSRSHVHRSLPKTLGIMKNMGFVDFEGYHSVYANTIQNFYAFLMGLSEAQVYEGCRPSWFEVVDSCPLIWENFEAHKYVTLHLDDWRGSFQWVSGVGFEKQPTDYFLNALFREVLEKRDNKSGMSRECASSEPLPSFMIRYTERFLKKFKHIPFFALTWFTMPLHDFPEALPNMDERLHELFAYLQSTPEIFENTVIILIGDHGERYGIFSSGSIEGFLERVLTPLFIRVPENLKIKHPEINFQENLIQNSDKLVTGFDVHQTLLHILALSSLSVTPDMPSSEFQAQHENRSSLFLPIVTDRDCSTVNIPLGLCVCNTTTEITSLNNPFHELMILRFAVDKLNEIVEKSKYSEKCESWDKFVESVVSADVIEIRGNSSKILLKFKVDPDEAIFEVQVLVTDAIIADNMKIVGEFSRITSYGNTSWCVGTETDEDKLMKSFCHCLDEEEMRLKENPEPSTTPATSTASVNENQRTETTVSTADVDYSTTAKPSMVELTTTTTYKGNLPATTDTVPVMTIQKP
ncbi:unnamed protein product, partial [Allacma fusca]